MNQNPYTRPDPSGNTLIERLAGWIAGWNTLPCSLPARDPATPHDLGMAPSDVYWRPRNPDATDHLLPRMMENYGLNPRNPGTAERRAMRDMERVCSHCRFTRQCTRALESGASPQECGRFCPNAMTLAALAEDH